MSLSFSPLLSRHQNLLWNFLHIALRDRAPAGPHELEALRSSEMRIYAENWGRDGDLGIIARIPGEENPIGACWMRLVPDGRGLAYVDEHMLRLYIALLPAYRNLGYGKSMMLAALELAREHGMQQMSLIVHPNNPCAAMFASCGFLINDVRNSYLLMQVTL